MRLPYHRYAQLLPSLTAPSPFWKIEDGTDHSLVVVVVSADEPLFRSPPIHLIKQKMLLALSLRNLLSLRSPVSRMGSKNKY